MTLAFWVGLALLTGVFCQSDEKREEAIKVPSVYKADQGGLPKRGYRVISSAKDYEAFEKLMKSKGAKLPEAKEIDFEKQRVIVADFGKAENCSGIYPKAIFRAKDGKVHIRYAFNMFQTLRIGDAPIPTYHAWSAMVMPTNEAGYAIETDHHRIKGDPEMWQVDAELKP